MLIKRIIFCLLSLVILFLGIVFTQKVSAGYACNANCSLNTAGCNVPLDCYIAGGQVCRDFTCRWEAGCSCTCNQRWYCDITTYTCVQTNSVLANGSGFQDTPVDAYKDAQCGAGAGGAQPPTCAQYLNTTYPGQTTGICYGGGGGQASCQAACIPPIWIKLKNASFSSVNNLINNIPINVSAYDSDDDASQRYFVMNAAGVSDPGFVSAVSIDLNGADASLKKWQVNLAGSISMSSSDFLSYVKSRKTFQTIAAISDITTNNYNNTILVSNSSLTITDANKANFNGKNLVVVINGDLAFNATTFIPTGVSSSPPTASTAFIVTGTITFANTTTEADAIFAAPNINLGTTANQGLKIEGNISTQALTNNRKWSGSTQPSFFVVFNPNQYINLLPLLSTTDYNWQQLQ